MNFTTVQKTNRKSFAGINVNIISEKTKMQKTQKQKSKIARKFNADFTRGLERRKNRSVHDSPSWINRKNFKRKKANSK